MAEHPDVTAKVDFGEVDGESLPLTKCVCGARFPLWEEIMSIYADRPWECPKCKTKLYFTCAIRVYQVPPCSPPANPCYQ